MKLLYRAVRFEPRPHSREGGKGGKMVAPHGGILINRLVEPDKVEALKADMAGMPRVDITGETEVELQNIALGTFSPLEGFMGRADVEGIIKEDRLESGMVWTIPVMLDVSTDVAAGLPESGDVALYNGRGEPEAVLRMEEKFDIDRPAACETVFGTKDMEHPGVAKLMGAREVFLGGKVSVLERKKHQYDRYNLSPSETRVLFREKGWKTVVGFQTRNPPHRAHEYLQKCALESVDGLFVNPVIGKKKKGDFTDDLILETYQHLIDNFYPRDRAVMSILPFEMRYAGPKEAVWHSIVRKNFGCTHFIVGRDHAGVGDYYDTYAAHRIFDNYEFKDLGITPMFYDHTFYCRKCGNLGSMKTCPHGKEDLISPAGKRIRATITEDADVEPEMMRPEIVQILKASKHPFVE